MVQHQPELDENGNSIENIELRKIELPDVVIVEDNGIKSISLFNCKEFNKNYIILKK